MAKYSQGQLRSMAQKFILTDERDPRVFQLLMQMVIRTGMSPGQIRGRIAMLAAA